MNNPLAVDIDDRELARSSRPVQLTENHVEPQISEERTRESGPGFLLDWLVGGEACQRDIRGFSVRFENLVAINAR
jgi:hypothetical protein